MPSETLGAKEKLSPTLAANEKPLSFSVPSLCLNPPGKLDAPGLWTAGRSTAKGKPSALRSAGTDALPAPAFRARGATCPGPASPNAPPRPDSRAMRTRVSATGHAQVGAALPERQAGLGAHGGRTGKPRGGAESRAAERGCAYLEAPPTRRRAAARPGAAAPPREAGAARSGAPRPRAPSGAGVRGGLVGTPAGGRWAEEGSERGGAAVGAPRPCGFACAAPARSSPAPMAPTRAPPAALRTEAAGRRPRLLAASGRPLLAAGRRAEAGGARGPGLKIRGFLCGKRPGKYLLWSNLLFSGSGNGSGSSGCQAQ